ncbi:beta strand repeat-containing protein [Vulcanococcus limneticus]|uniref:beta strand repeat-containing protein n=2 Tax=Vulcanococcus limneticus TaxID=2170428 RepID=UPI0012FF793C|nr:immunoglobulin-like domain-containing protein [Vulcanococcus limneticus]
MEALPPDVVLNPGIVAERGLVDAGAEGLASTTGTITIFDPDGINNIATVTIAGTVLTIPQLSALSPTSPVTISLGDESLNDGDDQPEGQLILTAFDGTTGVISFTYQLLNPPDNSFSNQNINGDNALATLSVVVTDLSGLSSQANGSILIIDDLPSVAISDSSPSTADEGSTISGTWSGSLGADRINGRYEVVVGDTVAALDEAIQTPSGTLTVSIVDSASGPEYIWTFEARPDSPFIEPEQSISFTIRALDGDDDIAEDSYTVSVNDTINTSTVTLAPVTVQEGNTATITATVDNAPQTDLTIQLDNGATVTILAGQTSGVSTAFTINNVEDVYKDPSSFSVAIAETSGGNYENLNTSSTATVSVNDTINTSTVTLAPVTVQEGNTATITATVDNAPQTDLTIQLDNGATVTILAGQTSGVSTAFTINNVEDVYKDPSSFSVAIAETSGGNYENLNTSSTATVSVNDTINTTLATLTANTSQIGVMGGMVEYTITLSSALPDYSPKGDLTFTLTNGSTVVIPAGSNSATIATHYELSDLEGLGLDNGGTLNVGITNIVESQTGQVYEDLQPQGPIQISVIDGTPTGGITLKAFTLVTDESAGANNPLQNGGTETAPAGTLGKTTVSYANLVNDTFSFGPDGAASSNSKTFSLATQNGISSGLKTSDGQTDILLYQVSPDLVEARAGSQSGALVFTGQVNNSGDLTLTQYSAVQHFNAQNNDDISSALATNALKLTVAVTDASGDSHSSSVDLGSVIRFEDDGPTAANITQDGLATLGAKTNIMLVIDVSGSMDDASGVGSMTRLDLQKSAAIELLDQYEALGSTSVRIVTFSSSAQEVGSTWTTVDNAKASILGLTADGYTNYDAALNQAWNSFGDNGKIADGQNILYFFSDGQPNVNSISGTGTANTPLGGGDGIDNAEATAWEGFLDTNNINAFAIGLGSGVNATALNPIAFNGSAGTQSNAIVVTDLSQLNATILSTISSLPISGLLLNPPSPSAASFGADGGWIQSITVDNTVYSYNQPTDTASSNTANGTFNSSPNEWTVSTSAGGSIKVDMDNGTYTYTPPVNPTSSISESIGFTLVDQDGDTSSASLGININLAGTSALVVRDDRILTNQTGSAISIPKWTLLANDTGGVGVTDLSAVSDALSGSVAISGTNVNFTDNAGADGGTFAYTNTTGTQSASGNVELIRSTSGTINGTYRDEVLIGRDANADTLNGGDGNDVLLSLGGNDRLDGGFGADILDGGAGNDTIIGGLGSDTITSGLGNDQFVYIKGEGNSAARDIITDFANGADTIVIQGNNINRVVVSPAVVTGSTNTYTITVDYSTSGGFQTISGGSRDIFTIALQNNGVLNDANKTGTPSSLNGIAITSSSATIDGTIVGATLYLDLNRDGIIQDNEFLGTSNLFGHVEFVVDLAKLDVNGDGQFTLGEARAVMAGGIDVDTQLTYEINLYGPVTAGMITPLTSLLQPMLEAGISLDDAQAQIVAKLGLPDGSDILDLNPITGNSNVLGQNAAVMTLAVQFSELVAQQLGTDEAHASFSVFEAISTVITGLPDGGVADFSDPSILASIAAELNLETYSGSSVSSLMEASQQALQYSLSSIGSEDKALASISAVQNLTQGTYAQAIESVQTGDLNEQALLDLANTLHSYTSGVITIEQLGSFNQILGAALGDGVITSTEFQIALQSLPDVGGAAAVTNGFESENISNLAAQFLSNLEANNTDGTALTSGEIAYELDAAVSAFLIEHNISIDHYQDIQQQVVDQVSQALASQGLVIDSSVLQDPAGPVAGGAVNSALDNPMHGDDISLAALIEQVIAHPELLTPAPAEATPVAAILPVGSPAEGQPLDLISGADSSHLTPGDNGSDPANGAATDPNHSQDPTHVSDWSDPGLLPALPGSVLDPVQTNAGGQQAQPADSSNTTATPVVESTVLDAPLQQPLADLASVVDTYIADHPVTETQLADIHQEVALTETLTVDPISHDSGGAADLAVQDSSGADSTSHDPTDVAQHDAGLQNTPVVDISPSSLDPVHHDILT